MRILFSPHLLTAKNPWHLPLLCSRGREQPKGKGPTAVGPLCVPPVTLGDLRQQRVTTRCCRVYAKHTHFHQQPARTRNRARGAPLARALTRQEHAGGGPLCPLNPWPGNACCGTRVHGPTPNSPLASVSPSQGHNTDLHACFYSSILIPGPRACVLRSSRCSHLPRRGPRRAPPGPYKASPALPWGRTHGPRIPAHPCNAISLSFVQPSTRPRAPVHRHRRRRSPAPAASGECTLQASAQPGQPAHPPCPATYPTHRDRRGAREPHSGFHTPAPGSPAGAGITGKLGGAGGQGLILSQPCAPF